MRTLDVMRNLDRDRYKLDFCALSGLSGDLDQEIANLGGTTHLYKMDLLFPIRFVHLLKRENYDVVHSHVLYMSGVILLLARLAGTPVRVAHFRTTTSQAPESRLRLARNTLLRALIDLFATNIIAVSKSALTSCWLRYKHPDRRCEVIYNGINLGEFAQHFDQDNVRSEFGLCTNSTICIHVGRFSTPKNHLRLISIFRHVRRLNPSAVLILVGGGDDSIRREVRQKAELIGCGSSLVFAGVRTDVPRLLKAADVMIFPSLWEGLPGAVLEACAAGIPVVASNLPGIVEAREQFASIDIVDLADSDEHWAIAVSSAIHRAATMTRAQLEDAFRTSQFDLAHAIERYTSVWKRAQ